MDTTRTTSIMRWEGLYFVVVVVKKSLHTQWPILGTIMFSKEGHVMLRDASNNGVGEILQRIWEIFHSAKW